MKYYELDLMQKEEPRRFWLMLWDFRQKLFLNFSYCLIMKFTSLKNAGFYGSRPVFLIIPDCF